MVVSGSSKRLRGRRPNRPSVDCCPLAYAAHGIRASGTQRALLPEQVSVLRSAVESQPIIALSCHRCRDEETKDTKQFTAGP